MKKVIIWLLSLPVYLLTGCGHAGDMPIELDTGKGTFRIVLDNHQIGPVNMEVNGYRALEEAFVFQAEDSLVAVSSVGELDMISVFRGDPTRNTLRLTCVNSGRGVLEISRVTLFSLPLNGACRVTEIDGRDVRISGATDLRLEFPHQMRDGGLWDCRLDHSEDALAGYLYLSGSAIVLLPGESLNLPVVNFFYHL